MFDYTNGFWAWVEKNETKIEPTAIAIYFFLLHVANKLSWRESFQITASEVMNFTNIKSYKTYKKNLDFLIENGAIELVEASKNQYSCNRIALVKFTKALTKASPKHLPKQVQSTYQSISHIHKTNNTNKTIKDYNTKKVKKAHTFSESVYHENLELFTEDFTKTKTYLDNSNIDIEKLFDTLSLADDKYKYTDWLKTAQAWFRRKPSEFKFSIKSKIEQDPISPLMNKGDKIRAENDARLEAQLKLTAHEDPYSKYH